ncbi:MAG TPA: hypothetical protein VJU87_11970 [Gemmatimonadaceae bacterium]|nr:hypothetical protein [Gemmatimonadaceae bacterium]
MPTRRLLFGMLLVSLGACTPATSSLGTMDRAAFTSASSDVLYAADLVSSTAADVYEAVLQVRPDFFRRHERLDRPVAFRRAEAPRVYLNGVDIGGMDAMRSIPLGAVISVRYVSAAEAMFRWGTDGAGGAVLVTTLR